MFQDPDPQETQEWLEAFAATVQHAGPQRVRYLLQRLTDEAERSGISLPYKLNTPYINTIPVAEQTAMPGDPAIEHRIRAMVRWNAAIMVIRANQKHQGLGGHIATFASAATLYDVGFNHFFKASNSQQGGDHIFIQGHSSPGIYARAFLEGRLSQQELDNFRQELTGQGLPSYPHPRLMPDFWQFPTVSMGLGPLMAVYQARFMKYLQDRKLLDTAGRKVWAFVGDGEMDEPEASGGLSLAGREELDNLIFVINCNLQRLDGPVRGNSKIIQELEGLFCGAGWNVIKVIWGGYWDPLLAQDKDGLLLHRMEEVVDGDYQNYKARDGAYTREHFFGKSPELKKLVEHLSDQDIWRLNRGGHDPHKMYAAYHAAVNHKGQPTVILAKTVKGYGMGESGEGQNTSHQQKKMNIGSLKKMRDRFSIPLTDEQVENFEYICPDKASPEIRYLHERREALGGFLPSRNSKQAQPLAIPPIATFQTLLESSKERAFSTTMAFVRLLTLLCRDKSIGKHIVPIVPDEARTFGMEGMFRQLGIYSSVGQLYEPQDIEQVMFYKEDKSGQILEEAICEAGAFASWIAAATAYSTHRINMIPVYIFYSMFGFQRIGDLVWAAGDMCARGFLFGATAGRTTLAGEGLQHQDGHSHLFAAAYPSCIAYDPCFAYELAVIVHHGLEEMYVHNKDVFFYITVTNENYCHPALPKGAEEGIVKGMYRLAEISSESPDVCLLGSGAILREAIAAVELLKEDWGVAAEIWSVTSFTELQRDAMMVATSNRLHPMQTPQQAYVTGCLQHLNVPVIAVSDYIAAHADQISSFISAPYTALGTDGFGCSDTRTALRRFFRVDKASIVVAALTELAKQNKIERKLVTQAIKRYELDVRATPSNLQSGDTS